MPKYTSEPSDERTASSRPPPAAFVDRERVIGCYRNVKALLLAERNPRGHWEGELSTSALSTATAVMALEMVRRGGAQNLPTRAEEDISTLIERGLAWIADHQNADGGWGDTTRSLTNISTTMLCHAVFHATRTTGRFAAVVAAAKSSIDRAGGVPALRERYGNDKTFSIPILTHCALAGLADWREVTPLPFELACVPANFYKWMRLPVVSYALPALIAIGQVRHHFKKPINPLSRLVRGWARTRSLAILERIQPASGGFLEAAPLTSFVTMSLAGMGLADHPVTRRGVEFLIRSVRPDGSWPIDTNLATWVTTLSMSALGPDLPASAVGPLRDWLLGQQHRDLHPYTNAAPGGWAWTDLSGGVPDADDTPGAILALCGLAAGGRARERTLDAASRGIDWLLDVQNSDGGWPTFCRGWGTLPFDRSAPDLTAHAVRALARWLHLAFGVAVCPGLKRAKALADRRRWRPYRAIVRGFEYLKRTQRPDGSWLPLWFGNQHAPHDENPTYGTSRVLAAYRDAGWTGDSAFENGVEWLKAAQNPDGGWGGAAGIVSSIEETALALELLISLEAETAVPAQSIANGLSWLLNQIDNGKLMEPSPIGFYFAKLWYFEKLYPLIFSVAALRRAVELLGAGSGAEAAGDF